MLAYWVLGVAVFAGLLLAGRWFVSAQPKQILKILKWSVFGVLVLTIGFLAVTGRLSWALMSLPILLPWFLRARALTRAAKNFSRMARSQSGVGSGQTSEVETRFLRMVLNHDTGLMTGEVVSGPYAGRQLDDLALSDLLELLRRVADEDDESSQVLAAYLDRAHPDWREQATAGQANHPPTSGGAMSREEAYEILGLESGATTDEIKEAHKRLIANLHPDRGGSSYLAAQINRAKDVLLD